MAQGNIRIAATFVVVIAVVSIVCTNVGFTQEEKSKDRPLVSTGAGSAAKPQVQAPTAKAPKPMTPEEVTQEVKAPTAPMPPEEPKIEKAQLLLEEVREKALERRIAQQELELKRFGEDLGKQQAEVEALDSTIGSISQTLEDSNVSLEKLSALKKHLARVIELTEQRIEAETLKIAGLRALAEAQQKARTFVLNRLDETAVQKNIGDADLKLLENRRSSSADAPDSNVDTGKIASEISDLKKDLEKKERSTSIAARAAREAMSDAAEKLAVADKATDKAKATAQEWGLQGPMDALIPVAVPKARSLDLEPVAEGPRN